MNTKLLLSLLLSLTMAASRAAQTQSTADDFDVVGVRFGMSVDEVKRALMRYDPKITFRETSRWTRTPLVPESLATLTACGHGPAALSNPCGESVVVGFGQVTKVAYFIRRVVQSESHLKQSEVANAIFAKYGIDGARMRSVAIRGDWFNWWMVPSTGGPTYGSSPYCLAETNDGGAPSSSRSPCNIAAFLNVVENKMSPGFNDRFEVAATSHALLQKEISAQRALASASDKAEHNKLNSEAKPAPKM